MLTQSLNDATVAAWLQSRPRRRRREAFTTDAKIIRLTRRRVTFFFRRRRRGIFSTAITTRLIRNTVAYGQNANADDT